MRCLIHVRDKSAHKQHALLLFPAAIAGSPLCLCILHVKADGIDGVMVAGGGGGAVIEQSVQSVEQNGDGVRPVVRAHGFEFGRVATHRQRCGVRLHHCTHHTHGQLHTSHHTTSHAQRSDHHHTEMSVSLRETAPD
jgi:hypothetical protein